MLILNKRPTAAAQIVSWLALFAILFALSVFGGMLLGFGWWGFTISVDLLQRLW